MPNQHVYQLTESDGDWLLDQQPGTERDVPLKILPDDSPAAAH